MNTFSKLLFVATLTCVFLFYLNGCHNPQAGPDKTLAGAVLGAGWGAGSGAVVGHQLDYTGQGAAVGAGFGAVAGAISGAGYDLTESTQLHQEKQLASLRVQNQTNSQAIGRLQNRLDQAISTEKNSGIYQVYFDADATNLRAGAVANLEVIAETIKQSAYAYVVNVVGHADDAGTPDYNERLAEARARTVSAYLAERGVSLGQIQVRSFGSKRPLATNSTDAGRQLNRRVDVYLGSYDG